ncbi:uncharacterized protein LOC131432764 [Malaya genurostris]|uniref:uncharacterized protein LOC131432764 n=1 Tax=Malaya genurostris TaxID=325434 RepID=UPI0026F4014E|nr:uncharacterized protein LOC131432764 [Malaya genurostris]
MIFLTTLILIVLASLCQALYTEKQEQTLNVVVGQCAEELGIDLNSNFTEQWEYTGVLFPDEEKSKNFAFCIHRTLGVLDANGMIKAQTWIDLLRWPRCSGIARTSSAM